MFEDYEFRRDILVLNRGNYTTCTIHLHGGSILSWRVNNKEILYLKEKTTFDHLTSIRGGIKYTFPYFGQRVKGPKHGFTRYVLWSVEKLPIRLENGDLETTICLTETEFTKSIWNYKFKISNKIILGRSNLNISVKVENTCNYFPFSFTILRHSIFRVENIMHCIISGLSKCKYVRLNQKDKTPINPDPNREYIKIERSYLDAFLEAPNVVEVSNITKDGLKLRITCKDDNDVLIYNPWDETGRDVPEDSLHNTNEYLYCLGVGNGYLRKEILLQPKETWHLSQTIEVIDEKEDAKIEQLQTLLSNPWDMLKVHCTNVDTDLYN